MRESDSGMAILPPDPEEFGRQLGGLLSPVEKDTREGELLVRGPITSGKAQSFTVRPGLRLFTFNLEVGIDAEMNVEADCSGVAIWLDLDGRCKCTPQSLGGRDGLLELRPRHNVVGNFQPDRYVWTIYGNGSQRGVALQMDAYTAAEVVSEYREASTAVPHPILANPTSPPGHICQALTPGLTAIAHQVLNCSLAGSARRLYMESKVLEILALQLGTLGSSGPVATATPDRAERERLEEARRILDEEYSDPPSLLALARRVGLNDFKLKRGFKTLFDTTAYGYVRKVRMENALAMLQGDALNVGDIAAATGYTSFGHFTAAFRKQFGIAPSDLKKGRKIK